MMNSFNVDVIRSKRKSIALEITKDLKVLVRAPLFVSDDYINNFIKSKSSWLEKHFKKMEDKAKSTLQEPLSPKLTHDDLRQLLDLARIHVKERVEYYAPLVGVVAKRITIRSQVSRWGSCSSKGNLNFNCLLMLTPPEVIDYVVVHELCHLIELNHSKSFWAEVERIMPNYKAHKKWLKENGHSLLQRLK